MKSLRVLFAVPIFLFGATALTHSADASDSTIPFKHYLSIGDKDIVAFSSADAIMNRGDLRYAKGPKSANPDDPEENVDWILHEGEEGFIDSKTTLHHKFGADRQKFFRRYELKGDERNYWVLRDKNIFNIPKATEDTDLGIVIERELGAFDPRDYGVKTQTIDHDGLPPRSFDNEDGYTPTGISPDMDEDITTGFIPPKDPQIIDHGGLDSQKEPPVPFPYSVALGDGHYAVFETGRYMREDAAGMSAKTYDQSRVIVSAASRGWEVFEIPEGVDSIDVYQIPRGTHDLPGSKVTKTHADNLAVVNDWFERIQVVGDNRVYWKLKGQTFEGLDTVDVAIDNVNVDVAIDNVNIQENIMSDLSHPRYVEARSVASVHESVLRAPYKNVVRLGGNHYAVFADEDYKIETNGAETWIHDGSETGWILFHMPEGQESISRGGETIHSSENLRIVSHFIRPDRETIFRSFKRPGDENTYWVLRDTDDLPTLPIIDHDGLDPRPLAPEPEFPVSQMSVEDREELDGLKRKNDALAQDNSDLTSQKERVQAENARLKKLNAALEAEKRALEEEDRRIIDHGGLPPRELAPEPASPVSQASVDDREDYDDLKRENDALAQDNSDLTSQKEMYQAENARLKKINAALSAERRALEEEKKVIAESVSSSQEKAVESEKVLAGQAIAAAIAGTPIHFSKDDRFLLGLGIADMDGHKAAAVSAAWKANEQIHVKLSVGSDVSGDNYGVMFGLTGQF